MPHIKDVTKRFAREGFVALAPDLYHGQASSKPDEARKLAMALDRTRAVQEITAAARYLQGMNIVQPKKVGVVGWCMGGGLALSTAAHNRDVGAAVAFYGQPLAAGDTANLHVPILGLYADQDHSVSTDAVRAFERELQARQVPHEIHVYPGAGHAFFNDTRPQVYEPDAAQDAWRRTLDWFRRCLV